MLQLTHTLEVDTDSFPIKICIILVWNESKMNDEEAEIDNSYSNMDNSNLKDNTCLENNTSFDTENNMADWLCVHN